MSVWRLRPGYFRGAGKQTFTFEEACITVDVDSSGEFDLTPEQFALIPTIGVYAKPTTEQRKIAPQESNHITEPGEIAVIRRRVDTPLH